MLCPELPDLNPRVTRKLLDPEVDERVGERVRNHVLESVLGRPERLRRVLKRVVGEVGVEPIDVGERNIDASHIWVQIGYRRHLVPPLLPTKELLPDGDKVLGRILLRRSVPPANQSRCPPPRRRLGKGGKA